MKIATNGESQVTLRRNFDMNALKSTFMKANDSIMELLKISPLPTAEKVGADHSALFLAHGNVAALNTGSKNSPGASTVDEKLKDLHGKRDSLKEKKNADYKDRVMKNGLKKKITKKEKKKLYTQANRLKLIRSQEPGSIFTPKVEETKMITVKPTKPVYNSEGKMVFSKFDFDETTSLSDMRNKKFYDPKALLHKLEKENESMKQLEMSGDTEKFKMVKDKQVWNKALQMADGVKFKDDPVLLAKSLKKATARKQKNRAGWAAREEGVDKKLNMKQQKREYNINDRKKKVKNNQLRKSAKRGRVIPGF